MEGYSVTEAASVLGVPTERVWELLARGVLAGTPEGEAGMRVFLQPRPAPRPPEPSPSNGNGGGREPERELSPFRELLTEFRSLTERYGQALLALGEARGEVAALRSRVDLLEARMDLRLPSGSAPMAPGRWSPPTPSTERPDLTPPPADRAPIERPDASPPGAGDETAAQAEGETGAEPRTARRDSPRRATESFAEALARAEDPSVPELPGGAEAAAALSKIRITMPAADAEIPEAGLPRELPPADEVPVAEEPEPLEPPAPAEAAAEPGIEPALEPSDPAESQPTAAEAASGEAPVEPEAPATEAIAEAPELIAAPSEAPPEPAVREEPAPEAIEPGEPAPEAIEPGEPAPEAIEPGEPAPEPVEPVEPEEPVAAASDQPEVAADGEAAAPAAEETPEPSWQERYTAEVAEPDWYDAEAFPPPPAAPPPDVGTDGEPPDAAPARAQADERGDASEEPPHAEPADEKAPASIEEAPAAGSAAGREQDPAATPRGAPNPPVGSERATLSRLRPTPGPAQEETVLWFGRSPAGEASDPPGAAGGADEMEVAPTGRSGETAPRLPGGTELDDALTALDALSRSAGERPPPAMAEPPADEPSAATEAAEPQPEPDPEPRPATRPSSPPPARPVPPTTTTTSRAYRRLRRIFPG